jgi:sulfite exporter TauE/SafE
MVLGFLPCGLLHAAIGAAAATSDPLAAAISMAAFTAGTFPMLWLAAYLGGWAQRRWHRMARPVMPVIALLNAIVLGGMAWKWIASA